MAVINKYKAKWFLGIPGGPESADDVLHLVNFDKIRDPSEKLSLVSATLNGAEAAGCEKDVLFINYK